MNARELAAETGANLRVVELFSVLHDGQRENEDNYPQHGPRGGTVGFIVRVVAAKTHWAASSWQLSFNISSKFKNPLRRVLQRPPRETLGNTLRDATCYQPQSNNLRLGISVD